MLDRSTGWRFNDLLQAAREVDHGPILATIEHPHPSLVYEDLVDEYDLLVISLCAEIGGKLIHLTNWDAAFNAEEGSSNLEKLVALEELLDQ